MKTKDLYWLSGLLEGEGSFLKAPPSKNSPAISCSMTDEDIISRVSFLLGVSYHEVGKKKRERNPHWKKSYTTILHGRRAIKLMEQLYPLMGKRRKQQIKDAINSYDSSKSQIKISPSQVREIRKRCNAGENQSKVASDFGLERTHVNKIYHRHRWKNVD